MDNVASAVNAILTRLTLIHRVDCTKRLIYNMVYSMRLNDRSHCAFCHLDAVRGGWTLFSRRLRLASADRSARSWEVSTCLHCQTATNITSIFFLRAYLHV